MSLFYSYSSPYSFILRVGFLLALSVVLNACDDDFATVKSNNIALEPRQQTFSAGSSGTREADQLFKVRNTGEAPLIISDIYLEADGPEGRVKLEECDFIASSHTPDTILRQDILPTCSMILRERPNELPTQVEPNQFRQLMVTYRPVDGLADPTNVTLVIESNGKNERVSIAELSISAGSPDIQYSPAVVFPGAGGTERNYLIRNVGVAPLVINGVSIELSDPTQFPAPPSGVVEFTYEANIELNGAVIAPNSSLSLDLIYTPEDTGADQANLVIRSNDPSEGEVKVLLTSEERPSTLTVTPNPVIFSHAANEIDAQEVSFINSGLTPVNVFLELDQPGDEYRITPQSSFQVPVQGDFTIVLEYRAQREAVEAALIVEADVDNFTDGVLRVPLRTNAAGALKLLSIDQQALSFNGVAGGESQSATVTITSNGDSPVTLSGAAITGTDLDISVFSVMGDSMGVLAPGESRELTVTFTRPPDEAVANSYQATLVIDSDRDGGEIQVSLLAAP